jgi:hypothetical protein
MVLVAELSSHVQTVCRMHAMHRVHVAVPVVHTWVALGESRRPAMHNLALSGPVYCTNTRCTYRLLDGVLFSRSESLGM